MKNEYKVDLNNALERLETVDKWGQQPEISKDLVPARAKAANSLLGLILTGTQAGFFPNTEAFNQLLMDKLTTAFDMGYYAHYCKADV